MGEVLVGWLVGYCKCAPVDEAMRCRRWCRRVLLPLKRLGLVLLPSDLWPAANQCASSVLLLVTEAAWSPGSYSSSRSNVSHCKCNLFPFSHFLLLLFPNLPHLGLQYPLGGEWEVTVLTIFNLLLHRPIRLLTASHEAIRAERPTHGSIWRCKLPTQTIRERMDVLSQRCTPSVRSCVAWDVEPKTNAAPR